MSALLWKQVRACSRFRLLNNVIRVPQSQLRACVLNSEFSHLLLALTPLVPEIQKNLFALSLARLVSEILVTMIDIRFLAWQKILLRLASACLSFYSLLCW
jgi:hypothetical protein